MDAPDTLIKYASANHGEAILSTGTLRWSSPELFDEPWAVKHDPKLHFDHMTINKAMLKQATSMIFTRDMPTGHAEHPLYKAIRRWRAEDRFKDEVEAFEALSELLAPTPETLKDKLGHIIRSWQNMVEHTRILCLSESAKELQSWQRYADNFRGLALRFDNEGSGIICDPKRMEYSTQVCKLTTIKEQVDDLVGIKRMNVIGSFESKLLTKNKCDAMEKEWRCIKVLKEEELHCGEDVEDWYVDEPFNPRELKAVYFGFLMPEAKRQHLTAHLRKNYPQAQLFIAQPTDELYDLVFQKISKKS